jgi:hypothetical protein
LDGQFKHTLFLAVTFDGKNQQVLLAFAVAEVENGPNNWLWFLDHLVRNFPGMTVFFGDYDKGIEAHDFQNNLTFHGILFSRCAKHLAANCRTGIPCKLSKQDETFIVKKLARARTFQQYSACLSELEGRNPDAARWMDERRELFSAYVFLDQDVRRFRILASHAGYPGSSPGIGS